MEKITTSGSTLLNTEPSAKTSNESKSLLSGGSSQLLPASVKQLANGHFQIRTATNTIALNQQHLNSQQLQLLSNLATSSQSSYVQASTTNSGIVIQLFNRLLPQGKPLAKLSQQNTGKQWQKLLGQTLGSISQQAGLSKSSQGNTVVSWPVLVEKTQRELQLREPKRNKAINLKVGQLTGISSGQAQVKLSMSNNSISLVVEQHGKHYELSPDTANLQQLAEQMLSAKGRGTQVAVDTRLNSNQLIFPNNQVSIALNHQITQKLATHSLLVATPSPQEAGVINLHASTSTSPELEILLTEPREIARQVGHDKPTAQNTSHADKTSAKSVQRNSTTPNPNKNQSTSTEFTYSEHLESEVKAEDVANQTIPNELLAKVEQEIIQIKKNLENKSPLNQTSISGLSTIASTHSTTLTNSNTQQPENLLSTAQPFQQLLHRISHQIPDGTSPLLFSQISNLLKQTLTTNSSLNPVQGQSTSLLSNMLGALAMLLSGQVQKQQTPPNSLAALIKAVLPLISSASGKSKVKPDKLDFTSLNQLDKGKQLQSLLSQLTNSLLNNKATIAEQLLNQKTEQEKEYFFTLPINSENPKLVEIKMSQQKKSDASKDQESYWQVQVILPVSNQGNLFITVSWLKSDKTMKSMSLGMVVDNPNLLGQVKPSLNFLENRLRQLGYNLEPVQCWQGDIPKSIKPTKTSRAT